MMDFNRKQPSQDEYEMQYYSMHSNGIFKSIFDYVIGIICKRCDAMSKSLINSLENKEMVKNVPKIIDNLKHLYIIKATPHLIKIKEKVNDWLKIPDNILAPVDAKQATQYDDSNIEYFKSQNEILTNKLKEVHMFQAALKHELECLNDASECLDNSTLLKRVEECLESCSSYNGNIIFLEKLSNFSKKIENIIMKTEKEIYNPNIDNIVLKKLD